MCESASQPRQHRRRGAGQPRDPAASERHAAYFASPVYAPATRPQVRSPVLARPPFEAPFMIRRIALSSLVLVAPAAAQDGDWPQFRGPGGLAVASDAPIPTTFGPDDHVLWKTKIPAGASSPCIVGERIYVTGFDEPANVVLAIDRRNGEVIWTTKLEGPPYPQYVHPHAGPALATTACDGERVIACFGNYGLVALDLDGKVLWEKRMPHPQFVFGVGTSPLLYEGLVVLSRDGAPEAGILVFDAADGSELWRID